MTMVGSTSCCLELVKQSGVHTESFLSHGHETRLHYVIKNQPFEVDVRLLSNDQSVDFASAPPKATLLYHTADGSGDREVTRVRMQPMKYKGVRDPQDPTCCRLNVAISVLSSQHEDMNFKLKVEAVDARTSSPIPGVVLYSEPIQVISKMAVLDGKSGPRGASAAARLVGKKRARKETAPDVAARLAALEAGQRETLTLLRSLQSSSSPSLNAPQSAGGGMDEREREWADGKERFSALFRQLVQEYASMPGEERPSKVRRTLEECAQEMGGVAEECVMQLGATVGEMQARAVQEAERFYAGSDQQDLVLPKLEGGDADGLLQSDGLEHFYSMLGQPLFASSGGGMFVEPWKDQARL